MTLEEKFEKSYMPEPNTGCWLWTLSSNGDGYGIIFKKRKEKKVYAHRFSYQMYKGKIPDGMIVCHKCDTPSCVNPDHLFVGTDGDNVRDCVSKGRHKFGRHLYRDMSLCKRGHSMTKENTIFRKRDGSRECRICAATLKRIGRGSINIDFKIVRKVG